MAIGTTAAILGAAAIGAAGSLAAGAISAGAASSAAAAQERSANKALDVQQQASQQAREDALPWLKAGEDALDVYMGELGISDEAKAGKFKSPFEETPAFRFQQEEGNKAVVNNLAALGLRKSGVALKALSRFNQQLAQGEYGNYLNRLSEAAGRGQTQAANTNQITINSANQQASTIQDAGAARASGYVGAGNAWSNALAGVSRNASNALGYFGYQPQYGNALNFTPGTGNLY